MKPLGIILCLWLATASLGIYPDHLSYFNEVPCWLHGRWSGFDCGLHYLDESNVDWGQGLKQLKTWLDANEPPGVTIRLALWGQMPAEAYGIKEIPVDAREVLRGTPGLYAVSAHFVARYGIWRVKPLAVVGHGYYIFEVR